MAAVLDLAANLDFPTVPRKQGCRALDWGGLKHLHTFIPKKHISGQKALLTFLSNFAYSFMGRLAIHATTAVISIKQGLSQ